jgi:hypothetical protein
MIALELVLVLWFVAIGVMVTAAFWPHGALGLALVSPAIGAAMYVFAALVLFSVDQFSTIGSLVGASVVAGGLVAFRYVRGRGAEPATVLRASGLALAGATVVFVVGAVGAFTRLTPDSIDYLTIAGGFERFGAFPDLSSSQILKRQFVVPVLQTGGVVTGLGYFMTLTTLIVASGFGFMVWLGTESLRRVGVSIQRVAVAGVLVGAFVLSTNRVLFHLFYVNGHGIFAALLLIAVGLVWHATSTRKWSVAVLAGIAAAAIVPLRAEGIIVVAFFTLPVLVSSATPMRARWAIVTPIAAVALLWNGVVLRQVLPADQFGVLSTPVTTLVVAAGLVAIVAASRIPIIARLLHSAPAVAFFFLVAYTAARVVRGSTSFYDTMEAMGANVAASGFWATFWWVAPLAIAVCIATVRVAHQSRLLWGLASFPIALLAFTYIRGSSYRVGSGDSGNRMLMHVVFVIGLYLIVAVGQLAAGVKEEQWSVRSLYQGVRDSLVVR